MSYEEEVSAAIGAHGLWKARLRAAIDSGRCDQSADTVAKADQCAFGKWFYELPPVQRNGPLPIEIEALHARFHQEAARVLRLALAGDKEAARKGIADESPYMDVSMQLVSRLMDWKRVIDRRTA
jgi:hypothetical protein